MYLRSPWNRSILWLDAQADDTAIDALLPCPDALDVRAQMDLDAALDRLTPSARAVVWLHDVEGYTHEEIAALYGKTVSFSKSQLMRAHVRLRQLLEIHREEPACTPLSTNS